MLCCCHACNRETLSQKQNSNQAAPWSLAARATSNEKTEVLNVRTCRIIIQQLCIVLVTTCATHFTTVLPTRECIFPPTVRNTGPPSSNQHNSYPTLTLRRPTMMHKKHVRHTICRCRPSLCALYCVSTCSMVWYRHQQPFLQMQHLRPRGAKNTKVIKLSPLWRPTHPGSTGYHLCPPQICPP